MKVAADGRTSLIWTIDPYTLVAFDAGAKSDNPDEPKALLRLLEEVHLREGEPAVTDRKCER